MVALVLFIGILFIFLMWIAWLQHCNSQLQSENQRWVQENLLLQDMLTTTQLKSPNNSGCSCGLLLVLLVVIVVLSLLFLIN